MKSPILKLAEQVSALPKEQQAALVTIADTLRESGASAPRRGRPSKSHKKAVKVAAPKARGESAVDRILKGDKK